MVLSRMPIKQLLALCKVHLRTTRIMFQLFETIVFENDTGSQYTFSKLYSVQSDAGQRAGNRETSTLKMMNYVVE